jgi:predicted glycoside hydrolase/deacetylase ChbG (UPF0249 family)
MAMKRLIVNGDDFGQSEGTTEGIIRAHAHGVLTSASLMVRWPSARDAAAYALADPTLDVGLHFDFGEWRYEDGGWHLLYEVVSLDDAPDIYAEALSQLHTFRSLLGRNPTHLDSHQHVHRCQPAHRVLSEIATRLNVPLRESTDIRYCGAFYGQDEHGASAWTQISIDSLLTILTNLTPGVTELVCHPSARDDVDSMYRTERQQELATLCNERIRRAIEAEGIQLSSFTDLANERVQHV